MSLSYTLYYFLPSISFQHLCPFLVPEKDTEVTDFSPSSIHTCPVKSINLPLNTDLLGAHILLLVFSPPVPGSGVCSPGSPCHILHCPNPVPTTHVCHCIFLIPLLGVLARSSESPSLVSAEGQPTGFLIPFDSPTMEPISPFPSMPM